MSRQNIGLDLTERVARYVVHAVVLSAISLGCTEPTGTMAPPTLAVIDAASVPTRASETTLFRWDAAPDSAVWSFLATHDSVLVIGLKRDHGRRGVYRGQVLISANEKSNAIASARAGGITVLAVDTLLPQLTVKVGNAERLAWLRQQAFVDFIEPRGAWQLVPMDGWLCGAGQPYTGTDYRIVPAPFNYGFDYAGLQYFEMLIDGAWAYTAGAGVIVGSTDTGLGSFSSNDEWSTTHFSEGYSAGRTHWMGASTAPVLSTCDHGTRSAGLITAPRNGRNMVGVAYQASFIMVTDDDDVLPTQTPARDAIRFAAQNGARVISTPWGIVNDAMLPVWSDMIADEIAYWVYYGDVLFVSAAGTLPIAPSSQNFVVFPAVMPITLAVSAAELGNPMERPSDANYGPELDVVAFTNALTTPAYPNAGTQQLTSLGASSGATAIVTGIGALVRARYPWMSESAVRNRLQSTAGLACGNLPSWHLLLNAQAAVGGPCVYQGKPLGTTSIVFDRAAYGDFRTETTEQYCLQVSGDGTIQVNWVSALPGSSGSSPNCRRYTFARGTYSANVTATVRDLSFPVPERGYSLTVSVVDLDANPGCPTCVRPASPGSRSFTTKGSPKEGARRP